jgi:hypothetical protein
MISVNLVLDGGYWGLWRIFIYLVPYLVFFIFGVKQHI